MDRQSMFSCTDLVYHQHHSPHSSNSYILNPSSIYGLNSAYTKHNSSKNTMVLYLANNDLL